MLSKKSLKKIFTIFLAGSLLYPSIRIVEANELNEVKDNLNSVESEIREAQKQINSYEDHINSQSLIKDDKQAELDKIKKEASELEQKIIAINQEIQLQMDKIYEIEQSIIDINNKIKEKELEIETLQKKIESNTELLKQRLVVMYKLGDASKIEILLQSSDINDFLSRNTMMTVITEYDKNLIETLKSDKKEMEKLLSELNGQKKVLEINKQNAEKEKQNLEAKVEEHRVLFEELKAKENERFEELQDLESKIVEYQNFLNSKVDEREGLASRKNELQAEITRIENEIMEQERAAEAARKAQREEEAKAAQERARKLAEESRQSLEDKRNELEDINNQMNRGTKLLWPTSATWITSPYGWRVHPIFGTPRFHSGVDIAGPFGTPIYAAEDGVVTYAGWEGGYGNVIYIKHDNGLVTVYAHLGGHFVSTGQRVSRGQHIAPMGSSGNSTGPHLHFEVQINGVTQEPLDYIR